MRKHLCSKCGNSIPTSGGYCRKCANEYMRNARSNGKFNNPSGPYKMKRIGTKTIREHRIVLGITDPKIYIHHIDNNGMNNSIDNLISVAPSEHYKIHHAPKP
jgi:ribosomal protein L40E